jgi:lipopolysaccharide transport system permease protein
VRRSLRPLISRVAHSAEIVWQLSRSELVTRYFQRSLSYFWLALEPLLLASTFFFLTLVLSGARAGSHPDYAEIFMGVVFWNWFRSTANAGMVSLLGSAGVLKQIRFSPLLVLLSRMLTEAIAFLFSLVLVLSVLLAAGKRPTVFWLEVPMGLAVQFLLSVALGAWLSMLGVFLRDSLTLVNFTLNLLMYVSPIVYRAEMVPARYRWLLAGNPFTALMRVYRNTLVDAVPIDNWGALGAWIAIAVLLLTGALWAIGKAKRKMYRFL